MVVLMYSTPQTIKYDFLMRFISNSRYFINFQQITPCFVKLLMSLYLLSYRKTSSRTVELDQVLRIMSFVVSFPPLPLYYLLTPLEKVQPK